MGKTKVKESKKAAPVEAVKPAKASKASAKDLAKAVPEKKSKKSKKPEPESSESESSESEADSDSASEDSASDSDSSESEAEAKPKANGTKKVNGSAKAAAAKESSDSDSSDSSESEEEAEAVKPAKAVNGKAKKAESDSDDSSDSEEAESKSDSSDSDSDEEEDSDDSDSDSDEAETKVEKTEAPSKKRKADADAESDEAPKKAKTEATTLFAGSLSWGVDDNLLWESFKEFDGLVGARVVMDKHTGRSRGFGYVDFGTSEACVTAYEAMQGKEIDGRAINLDYANARTAEANPRERANDRANTYGDTLSPETDTLFVGNLPFDVDQETVREFFGDVAEVASIRLPTDMETGNLKGFGYVSFNSVEDAKAVLTAKTGGAIGTGSSSRTVRLDFAGARPPPREGGGFGDRGGRGGRGGGRGGFGDRGGRGGRGGFGGRGGGRGGFGDRGGRGGRGGAPRGGRGASSFAGTKMSFD
ncbi:RNA-binding domain-containing protein [Sarocladium strictum]